MTVNLFKVLYISMDFFSDRKFLNQIYQNKLVYKVTQNIVNSRIVAHNKMALKTENPC